MRGTSARTRGPRRGSRTRAGASPVARRRLGSGPAAAPRARDGAARPAYSPAPPSPAHRTRSPVPGPWSLRVPCPPAGRVPRRGKRPSAFPPAPNSSSHPGPYEAPSLAHRFIASLSLPTPVLGEATLTHAESSPHSYDAGGDRFLGRGAVEVVQVVEQVGPVVGTGLVVRDEDNGLRRADLHAQPAIAALVHLDIEARQQPVLGLPGRLDVNAAIGADPLTLETDNALVVVGLGVDRQRQQAMPPRGHVQLLQRVRDRDLGLEHRAQGRFETDDQPHHSRHDPDQPRSPAVGVGHHLGAHRSTSDSTISMLPRIAITSATFHPRIISVRAYRLENAGARIFTRYGLSAPSLTR